LERLEERLLLSVSPASQEFIHLLNQARHDPARLARDFDLPVDLAQVPARAPLAIDDALSQAAAARAQEMARDDYFGHQSAVTGKWPNQIAREQGYALPSDWPDRANFIESIAAGTEHASPEATLKALLADEDEPSLVHRRQLLGIDEVFSENRVIGVAQAANAEATFEHYWAVQTAHSDPAGLFLTGVVFTDANQNGGYDAGEGLAGVTITAGDLSTMTNTAGGWTLRVAPGEYHVVASGVGLSPPAASYIRLGQDNVEVDFLAGRMRGVVNFAAWQNSVEPLDANDDGSVTPLDVLVILNDLNTQGARELPRAAAGDAAAALLIDVNGDDQVSALDVLAVINALNQGRQTPEHSVQTPVAVSAASPLNSPGQGESAALSAQPFVPSRGERLVNALIPRLQTVEAQATAVATSPAGITVVAFCSHGLADPDGVYARRLDDLGNTLGDVFRVNTTTRDVQQSPSVAMAGDGSFVIVWDGRGPGDKAGSFAQWFDASGHPVGNETRINTTTGGVQERMAVAMAADGRSVMVWQGAGPGDCDGIFLQRFAADRTPLGGETRVNTYTAGSQAYPSVAISASGDFVVTWSSRHQDGSDWGIFGQRFAADGMPLGAEFPINAQVEASQIDSSVAMGPAGDFVVAWSGYAAERSAWDIYARGFTADGQPYDRELLVNSRAVGQHKDPHVAMLGDGGFLVTWTGGEPNGAGWEVFGRMYTAAREADAEAFQINTVTLGYGSGHQQYAAAAVGNGPRALLVWSGRGKDDPSGVYVNVWDTGPGNRPPVLNPIPDQTVSARDRLTLQATASDPDLPANRLTFRLATGAPDGAAIDPATGRFTWTPTDAQAGRTYAVTVQVVDDGTPALSATTAFAVQVLERCAFPSDLAGWTVTTSGGSEQGHGTVVANACQVLLSEGDSFRVALEKSFTIPAEPSALRVTFENLQFDTSDPNSINDAFEMALVDEDGHSLVRNFAGARDAFLNISEDLPASYGEGIQVAGNTVTVGLNGLLADTPAKIIFRLVNDDLDHTTSLHITGLELVPSDLAVAPQQPIASALSAAKIDFQLLSDVSSSLSGEYGRTSLNDGNDVLSAGLTLRNTGRYAVDGPLLVGIANLNNPSVLVRDFDGVTDDQIPYFEISSLPAGKTLQPGEVTGSRALSFYDPQGLPFTYDLVVLGHLNRPPSITSNPVTEALVGQSYRYEVRASDPEGDPLTFSLAAGPGGALLDPATGVLTWTPTVGDVGTQTVEVRVEDGRGGVDRQAYQLVVRQDVPNRPPLFTSEPVADANVAAYFEVVDVPVGEQPAAVAPGDFTGQGALSLATANPGDQTVSVAAGQGDGTFGQRADQSVGDPPPEVWRDFYEPLGISVGFADPTSYHHDVSGLARGDFNHDGLLDLAAATGENVGYSSEQYYMVVLLGPGDGTFASPVKISMPASVGVLTRDFDRDGELDLLAVSNVNDQVYFLRGRGDGTFASPIAAGATGDQPVYAVSADVNGDGILDLAVNSQAADQITILPGRGDGTFGPATILSTGDNPMTFALADVDGSGSIDLVVGSYGDRRFEVRLNDGTGQFASPILTTFSRAGYGGEQVMGLYVYDFDRDGKADIVAAAQSNGFFGFFKGDGAGQFVFTQGASLPGVALIHNLTDNDMPDFNGDGQPDPLFARQGENYFTIAISRGDGSFDFRDWMGSAGPEVAVSSNANTQGAHSVIFGDFNNDGVLDLVSAAGHGYSSGHLSLLLGDSATQFSGVELINGQPSVWSDAYGVVAEDFNNDGRQDVLCYGAVVGSPATFYVQLGQGDGSFGPPMAALPRVSGPGEFYADGGVRSADFDHDGNLDLVFLATDGVQSGPPPRGLIAFGHGDGTFSLNQVLSPESAATPQDVEIADFNEDGFVDLAVRTASFPAYSASPYMLVEIWLNDPAQPGSFTRSLVLYPGRTGEDYYYGSFVAADVNGDGHQDIVVHLPGTSDPPSRLMFYAGWGDGTFADPRVTNPATARMNDLVAGDFNRDGFLDLAGRGSNHINVLLGEGDGTFQLPVHYEVGSSVTDLLAEDLDRDGALDLIAEYRYGAIVFHGRGNGTFRWPIRYAQSFHGSGSHVGAADFDGDGAPDLVTIQGDCLVSVYRSVKPGLQAVAVADINADGRLDLFAANARNGHITPLLGNGDNTFTRQADILAGLGAVALAVGDLNGDGRTDFVTANQFVSTLSVLVNDGTGKFARADLAARKEPIAVAIGDLNGDGLPDLAAANQGDNTLSLFVQQADGSYARTDMPAGGAPAALSLADLTGDGRLDIAVTGPDAQAIFLYENTGAGTFAAPVRLTAGFAPDSVAVGDINGDQRPDLVVGDPRDGHVGIFYGQGGLRYTRPQMVSVGKGPSALVLADMDGDGRLDIVVSDAGSNMATVLLNRFDPARAYVYQPTAEDPDGDPLTYTLVDGPGGMFLDPSTGRITWAPGTDQYGQHPVTIEVSDGRGGSATQTYTIAVGLPQDNHKPIITSEPATSVTGTQPYTYQLHAVDPDDDPLHYEFIAGPEQMTFDVLSRQVQWDARGTALAFDGQNRVDIPDAPSLHPRNLTLEGWFRLDDRTSTQDLFWKAVGGQTSFMLWYSANSQLKVWVGNSSTTVGFNSGYNPTPGEWFHVAYTFDDDLDTQAIYINGVRRASATATISLGYDSNNILLGCGGTTNFFRGAMDEIRIWSVARSEAEIVADMRRALSGDEPGLLAYYPADDGQGKILHDRTSYGNDAYLGEPGSFAPRWIPSFGLQRAETVTVRVQDAWGAVTDQTFVLTVTAETPATIRGTVYDDQNADGTRRVPGQPATEAALADRVVFIDANHNGLREPEEPAATTDAGGAYTFTDLAAGSYTVSLLGEAGWRPTTPSDGAANLSVVTGQTLTADFGSTQQGVSAEDRAPAFTSTAPSQAQVDQLYRYAAAVGNPDNRPVTFDLPMAPEGLTVDPVTGAVGWIPSLSQTGAHRVLLRVCDDRGLVAIQDFTVDVQPVNTPPTIVSQAPEGPAGIGLPLEYRVRAVDADQDPITFVLAAAPTGATLDPATGLLTWTPAADQVGAHALTVAAQDGRGGEARQIFALEVQTAPVNRAPAIASSPRLKVRLGDLYRYEPIVGDPDSDPLTFILNVAPAGMSVDSDGVVTWTAGPVGTHAVQLQVSDGRGGTAVQDFTIEVRSQAENHAPVITSRPTSRATLGSLYSYNLTATDADGDPLRWLLSSGPAGMALDELTGALRWTPRTDQLGPADVTVQVVDLFGGEATQSFTLTVRGTNAPPAITTSPPTEAAVGETYVYPVGVGAAEGDVLTFSLPTAPAGMTINAQTGVIGWTPEAGQVGAQAVKVYVANAGGGAASQTFEIVVQDGLPNQAPVISSTPSLVATIGQAYQYAPTAADPEGQPLHFELRQEPVGMSIDPATGQVDWTPTDAQLGDHVVTIAALDPDGAAGLQSFVLTVLPANAAPRITSVPVTTGTAGAVYRYDVAAVDDDHDPLWYTLTTAPAGMTVDLLGRITWASSAADLGTRDVSVTVSDGRGGSATQSFQINLDQDKQAPRLSIYLNPTAAYPGETVLAQVRAVDNVGVTGLELTVNGQIVPLSSGAIAAFTASGSAEGDWMELLATARDAAGNVGTSTARVRVIPTEGWGIPEESDLAITSPAADATVTTFTDVIGTASVRSFREYRLLYRPADGDTFTQFASGTAAVRDGKLGTFDPTALSNDTYVLRLEVEDQSGGVTSIEQNVNVRGELKLGNFQLSFQDITIPVSGIPITVARTYDSLQADREGDCGYGWRLEYRNVDLRVSVKPSGMEDFGLYTPFRDGTHVYVTLPGGRREGFTFTPDIHGLLGLIYFTPRFTPDPGVTSTLTVQKATLVNKEGEYYTLDGQPYNPIGIEFGGAYTLTTKDGTAYRVDATSGKLLTVTDRNSNRLTFSDSGVLSSTGTQVTFERDGRGRITAAVDPMGNKVRYAYDLAGDLVSVTDREGNVTRFEYDAARPHYLSEVIDPLGRTGVRTEYDDQGRLVKAIDAAGHVVEVTHDPSDSVETVLDQLGNPTMYEYDDRGNVVAETNALGGVTQRTYDDNNNTLTQTDPLGHTTTYTYDSRGNVLSEVDPLGNTTRRTYNARGQELTVTDPLGNTVTNTYDDKGNLLSTEGGLSGPVTYTYDANGRVLSSTDSAGTTTFQYDATGNLIRQVSATGIATGYAYDANGRNLTQTVTVTTTSGPQTLVTRTEYDAEGRVTKMIARTGSTAETQYDALGQEAASIDALGRVTRFRYDDRGQLIETIYPDDTPADDSDNPRTRTEYDAAGRTVAQIDESGRRTESVYDSLGRCVETIYPDETSSDLSDNPRVRTEFDAAGRTAATIDERGNRTEYLYDDAGRQIETILPDSTPGDATDNPRMRSEYDAAGHQIATIDPLGHRTEYVYDNLGLLRETRFADGTSTADTFDARGQLVAHTDQAGQTTQYERDATGRLTAVVDALGQHTEYAYDELGNQVRQTDANGHVTQFEQDYLNRRRATELPLAHVRQVSL
jgi:YD repeat-containing protein